MRQLVALAALAAALIPCAVRAAETPPIHVGSIYAAKAGNGPQTLVLIPGLGCGPWVWRDFVAGLPAGHFTVYEITPAGFDGTPPSGATNLFAGYAASIVQLIREQHVAAPILIGHSMGGELALRIGESHPELARGIVLVDSLPLFPPLGPNETLASRPARWRTIVDTMKAANAEEYAASEERAIATMVSDPKATKDVAQNVLRSDHATVAESEYDLATTDLSTDLGKLVAPTLVLGETGAGYPLAATEQFYRQQYAAAKTVTVKVIPDSRHFIMLDQPAAFQTAVMDFIATLK